MSSKSHYNDELLEMILSNPSVHADDLFDYYGYDNNDRFIIVYVYGDAIARIVSRIWKGEQK